MVMLAKIRQMHIRDGLSLREISAGGGATATRPGATGPQLH